MFKLRTCAWPIPLAAALALAVGLPCVAAADAPVDPATLMPEHTLAFVGWAGADSLSGPVADTAFGRILAEPTVKRFLDQVIREGQNALKRNVANRGGRAAALAQPLLTLGGAIWHRPWATGLIDYDPSRPGSDRLDAALVIHVGADRTAFQSNVDQIVGLLARAAGEPAPLAESGDLSRWSTFRGDGVAISLSWAFIGDFFCITTGRQTPQIMNAVLAGGKSLKDAAGFAAVRDGIGLPDATTAGRFYIDMKRLLARLPAMVSNDAASQAALLALTAALGLDALEALGGAVQFTDGATRSTLYLVGADRHRGLLRLFEGKPLEESDLLVVPKDATFLYATNLDLGPEGGAVIAQAVAFLNPRAGAILGQDVLPALGDTCILFNAPSNGGIMLTGMTLCIDVIDAGRLQRGLKSLVESFDSSGARNLRTKTVRDGGADITFIVTRAQPWPIAPAWAVHGDRLVVGLFPQIVQATLARLAAADAREQSILAGAEFQSGRKRLPEYANALAYFDTRRSAAALHAMALPLLQLGAADLQSRGIDLDISMVPPAQALTRHMFPSMSATRVDPAGVLMESYTSMPVFNPSITEAVVLGPIVAAILVPMAERAEARANRGAALGRMRVFGPAVQRYADEHADKPPGALDDLLPYLKDGRTALTSPADQPGNTSYVLLTGFPPMKEITRPAERVLIYEKPALHDGAGTFVLFADGHCQWRPAHAFQADLESTKRYLAELAEGPKP